MLAESLASIVLKERLLSIENKYKNNTKTKKY
jgi:hypothetical protein